MGLFERRSSRDDHDDGRHRSNSPDRHHPAHDSHSTDATESPGPSFASRMQASMQHLRMSSSRNDMSPYHAISHYASHFLPHSSSDSRGSSAKTSSSSLRALHEDAAAVDARSEHTHRTRLGRRTSQQADTPASLQVPSSQSGQSSSSSTGDFPVYPNQSYSALQYQPPLRGRSSYPSNTDRSNSSLRIGGSTTPGLFSGRSARTSPSIGSDDSRPSSPHLLHPMHLQPPKETHTADIERDSETGNKRINDYEILEELGRGEHGKVKLGRHIYTNQRVAIKIVQRYSKRRRLGKLGDPEDKVKKEVAILKKARHPNVVSLLEVIDDPNLQKVYIVLEYVENGEIKWRKKGNNAIVQVDKLRMEREKQGIYDSPTLEEAQQMYRAQAKSRKNPPIPAWSLEHGALSDDESSEASLSRTVSQNLNLEDLPESANVSSVDQYLAADDRDKQYSFLAAFDGSMYGPYVADPCEPRHSTSSLFKFPLGLDTAYQSAEDDDLSYVPCLTIDEARNAFRDALLGLEYLHYQGIIHRDIKPANLLVTAQKEVKISDFGVSYLGRPISDDDEEHVSETDAAELDDARGELSKTVGTPAFYAPELCYISEEYLDQGRPPKITAAIDIWSLGVTLYGMIFGRLPFVSDDEYGLFQSIGKDEPFIPRKRLAPVEYDPPSDPNLIPSSKRRDDELRYEDIDPDLRDLLTRLLTKDPQQRISIKAIKEHPWVVKGLPKDRNLWLQETDQSKVHRIEVSNEEVTSAVSKVPFVDRVKNQMARLSSYIVNRRDSRRDGRRRTPSATGMNADSFRDFREGRRASLRGDEDMHRVGKTSREPEHHLSHSALVSPESAPTDPSGHQARRGSECLGHAPRGQSLLRRHGSARAASVLSSADSTKTIRAPVFSDDGRPASPPRSHPDPTSVQSHSYRSGGVFRASSQRRGSDVSEGEASLLASGHGPADGDSQCDSNVHSPHPQRPSRSQPFSSADRTPSARPFQSNSLWRAPGDHMTPDGDHGSRGTSPGHLGDDLQMVHHPSSFDAHHHNSSSSDVSPRDSIHCLQNPGMTRSPPSATTISSTSVDDGMSPSTSHPSIPSVISGASSLCSEGFRAYAVEQRPKEMDGSVPSMLRTVDTVTVKGCRREHEIDEHDESEDEGIVFGKRR